MEKRKQQRNSRRRERELMLLVQTIKDIKAGTLDHWFVDAQTKTMLLDDLRTRMCDVINAEVDANPDIYERFLDGRIGLVGVYRAGQSQAWH